MVYTDAGPTQPFSVGITVIVDVFVVKPLFIAVKLGTSPTPFAAKPIVGSEFVHV
jgi:hypothetical protein